MDDRFTRVNSLLTSLAVRQCTAHRLAAGVTVCSRRDTCLRTARSAPT